MNWDRLARHLPATVVGGMTGAVVGWALFTIPVSNNDENEVHLYVRALTALILGVGAGVTALLVREKGAAKYGCAGFSAGILGSFGGLYLLLFFVVGGALA